MKQDLHINTNNLSASNRVAVIIVNWNSGDWLRESLEALSKQSFLPSRVLVFDNASSDSSLEQAENAYPSAEFIRFNNNVGFAEANNRAVKMIDDCEWIALLNPDAIAHPNWLEQLVQATQSHKNYDCFGSHQIQYHDGKKLDGIGDVYHVSGTHWRFGHGKLVSSSETVASEIFSPCAAAAMFSLEAFREVTGFDEDYFCYSEDVDLGFRLRLIGKRCLYVPDAIVRHVGSALTGGKHSDFSLYYGHRNLVWTYFKDMPGPLFWIYLPQHLLLNLASLLWFSIRGHGAVIFKAKWDAIKGLPNILKKRRHIQANRRVSCLALRRVLARGLFMPYIKNKIKCHIN